MTIRLTRECYRYTFVTVRTPLSCEVFWHEYAKIPLPQAIWNFGYITENGVNSNYISRRIFAIHSKGKKRKNCYDILGAGK